MALKNRHVGFSSVAWAGLSIDKCTALQWDFEESESYDLSDDDVVTRQGHMPGVGAGRITLTGRNIGLIQPTYWGRSATMSLSLIEGSGIDVPGTDTLTLYDACLVSFSNDVPTAGLGSGTRTFAYSRLSGGSKSAYTIT